MRILYFSISFPQPNKGSTIYTDLAEELVRAGHNITVVTPEEKKNKVNTKLYSERGFEVLRIKTGNIYDVGYIEKGISTLTLPLHIKRGIKKYLTNKEFDLVLYESPPVTNYNIVKWVKSRYNCKSYLMLKDIFPQNAIDLDLIKKNGILHKYFRFIEKKLYKTSDIIGTMSEMNRKFIINNNQIDRNKVKIFPNTKKLAELDIKENVRKDHNIPEDACIFMFGGNMGKPQFIDLLVKIIIEFRENKNAFFFFIGRGTDRYKLEEAINENCITNAKVIHNLPRRKYEEIVCGCDVGLVVLNPAFTIPNFPSRILSYMEFSKPILALTDNNTDLKELLVENRCGYWAHSNDVDECINGFEKFINSNQIIEMGSNARDYLEKEFDVKKSVELLEMHINLMEE